MEYDKPEFSEILEAISRLAGNLVGAAVVALKKIELCAKELTAEETRLSVKGVTKPAAGPGAKPQAPGQPEKPQLQLKSELKALHAEKKTLTLNLNQTRNQADEAIARQEALKLRAATLQSDLTTAREQLSQARSKAEKVHSELALQLNALQAENRTLISDVDTSRREAEEAKTRERAVKAKVAKLESHLAAMRHDLEKVSGEGINTDSQVLSDVGTGLEAQSVNFHESTQEKAAEEAFDREVEPSTESITDRNQQVKIHIEQQQPPPVTAEVSLPADVTTEELQTVVFAKPPDRVIFTRALLDLASPDAATRTDAARAMATVHHELSVRALVANLAREPSPLVRRECIKALTSLEMKEGLSAIKRALADPAASVRLVAVWGLYRLAGTEGVLALTEMFFDENEQVRRRAVNCIAWLGKMEKGLGTVSNLLAWQVISGLIGRLEDPAESVKKAVLGALETITGKKMAGPLPIDEKSRKNLISQWHKWWKEKLLE